MMTRYVQSKWSKDAPVRQVNHEQPLVWDTYDNGIPLALPKSEYHEVPAPEQWEEISVSVVEADRAKDTFDPGGVYHGDIKIAELLCKGKYRIKTLVVERKVES